MIFSHARGAFLEFLRNLTPQILLLSIALVSTLKLDLNRFDLSNTVATLPFLLIMGVFCCAALANMSMFFENSFKSLEWVEPISKRLLKKRVKGKKHLIFLWRRIWRRSKIFAIEILVTMIVLQVGMLAVFIGAIQAATNIAGAIKH